MELEIKLVKTHRELNRFIDFQFQLYKGNPYWCPPLRMDEIRTLRKDKNPAFAHCEAEYWIAYRGYKPVGRIAGLINHKANQRWGENLVRFGWIDFIDDQEVSGLLIATVEKWGKGKGMVGIHGPLGFSDMDNEGMLIEGFDQLAIMTSIYNHPYYQVHMERMGFVYDASYVKLRNIALSYTIPSKVLKNTFISGITLTAVASNVLIIFKNLPHADPESGLGAGNLQGYSTGSLPTTRNFSLNLKFTF